ncbi:kielin/chordin-like protein [Arapaima gigas]
MPINQSNAPPSFRAETTALFFWRDRGHVRQLSARGVRDALGGDVDAFSCPDGNRCPDGSTCCQGPGGHYSCCPLPRSLPMIPAFSKESGSDNRCGDNTHCPPEYSCLKTPAAFSCCPLLQGVPCLDGKHCCPEGHRCAEDARSCITQTGHNGAIFCPDEEFECPEGTTCCQLPDNSWGCCPMSKAVCCEDRTHCCPEGTTCNIKDSKCLSPLYGEMPMWKKLPASCQQSDEARNVSCDSTHSCPDESTCCKTTTGDWACCPLPEAVCCEDHVHCCPHGTTCNADADTCESSSGSVPWLEKVPAMRKHSPLAKVNSSNHVHCGSNTNCPKDTTCCFIKSTGKWGCCPFPKAVCCKDGTHCCPPGYTCDGKRSVCSRADVVIPWYNKMEAIGSSNSPPAATPKLQSSCPSGTPCHPLSSGNLGCCPLVNAVCCPDMKHCCPSGYTCDLTGGSCTKLAELRWDTWNLFFGKRRPFIPL